MGNFLTELITTLKDWYAAYLNGSTLVNDTVMIGLQGSDLHVMHVGIIFYEMQMVKMVAPFL